MRLDLPFSFDPDPQEPACVICGDSGFIERGEQLLPCPDCREAEYEHVIACGGVEP